MNKKSTSKTAPAAGRKTSPRARPAPKAAPAPVPADHRPAVAAQRRERMRAWLQQAALQAVVAKGGTALPIDEFLAVAGVSRATFYKYYPDTASLVQAMAQALSDEVIAHLDTPVKAHDDAAARLAVGMLGMLRLAEQWPAWGALLTHTGWPRADIADSHAFHALVRTDIERGLASGRFTAMDARLALDLSAAAVIAAAHRLALQPRAEGVVEQAVAAALRALGVPRREATTLARQRVHLPAWQPGSMLEALATAGRARA